MNARCVINKNIIKYCIIKKISYQELSNKLGKEDDFINKMLSNKYKKYPTLDMLDKIAAIFMIPTARLFDGWEEIYK